MQNLGDYRIDDYISFGVQLHRFSSGAVYAPTGNATYTFYEDNSTTGAPTGGNLAQLNSKTGLYTARVQLTAANGFEAGKEYFIHIEATVDSVAAGELFHFRVVANPKVDLDTIKTQAVTCAAGVTVAAYVGTAAQDNAQTGDSYAIVNGDHGLVSIQDDIDSILADTNELQTNQGNWVTATGFATATELAKVPKSDGSASWNTTALAAIQGECTDALNAYDPPTNAEMEARTLAAADYTVVSDLGTVQTGDAYAIVNSVTYGNSALKTLLDTTGIKVATNADKTDYTVAAGGIAVGSFASGAITDAAVASDAETAIANAVKASVVEVQGSYTLQQVLSIILSVLAGITTDNGVTVKTPNGSATRVAATVDSNNNRTAMTLTPSA